MSDAVMARAPDWGANSRAALKGSGVAWFAVALIGQFLFALYILGFYGGTALAANWQAWNDRLINGFVDGDVAGNFALVSHMALALIMNVAGPLQFVPAVRKRARTFHRWTGRIYITTAFVISIGALYMVNARPGLGAFNSAAIQIDALLIMLFAGITLRFALKRQFAQHHRWALRTFMVVSGVWFMRVGYTVLGIAFQGDIPGVTSDLNGPTDIILGYACYLLPLAVLELYFLATDNKNAALKFFTAGAVGLSTIATAAGIIGLTLFSWLPKVQGALAGL
ncbi:DUF2306 domain-containing protein [Vitreimonas flagellata]|uniref:DUF2306 domain-containing protein n=1 Tax=Vitreimonas flagellata TaxID=2560861 RepID=UPI001074FC9A|nr:DUF2306 domain-containing protein [Vitreimonas flagellata]